MKINTISIKDADYPLKLRVIPDAPLELHWGGCLPDQDRPVIAIVGTRRPTAYGRAITEQLASGLVRRGAVIASGLALGVDAIAHQACLEAGGTTIAVLPTDLGNPYPRSHLSLAHRIMTQGGTLISEYKYNPRPARWDFLKRNRLVSGLADAVIVTEAGVRSGTMSTVTHALAQGRDVYAVPGPITSPLSGGCNRLIAQGATPVTDVEECIAQLLPTAEPSSQVYTYNDNELRIVTPLEQGICDGEELLEASGLAPSDFHQTMTLLEIRGAIHALGGNQWRL